MQEPPFLWRLSVSTKSTRIERGGASFESAHVSNCIICRRLRIAGRFLAVPPDFALYTIQFACGRDAACSLLWLPAADEPPVRHHLFSTSGFVDSLAAIFMAALNHIFR